MILIFNDNDATNDCVIQTVDEILAAERLLYSMLQENYYFIGVFRVWSLFSKPNEYTPFPSSIHFEKFRAAPPTNMWKYVDIRRNIWKIREGRRCLGDSASKAYLQSSLALNDFLRVKHKDRVLYFLIHPRPFYRRAALSTCNESHSPTSSL